LHFAAEVSAKVRGASSKKEYGSGKETLRLRSKGAATIETVILFTVFYKYNYLFIVYCSHKSNWIYKPREN